MGFSTKEDLRNPAFENGPVADVGLARRRSRTHAKQKTPVPRWVSDQLVNIVEIIRLDARIRITFAFLGFLGDEVAEIAGELATGAEA